MKNILRRIHDWRERQKYRTRRQIVAELRHEAVELFYEASVRMGPNAFAQRKWRIFGSPDLSKLPRKGDPHPALKEFVALDPFRVIDDYGDTYTVIYHRKPPVVTPAVSRRRWAAYPVPA